MGSLPPQHGVGSEQRTARLSFGNLSLFFAKHKTVVILCLVVIFIFGVLGFPYVASWQTKIMLDAGRLDDAQWWLTLYEWSEKSQAQAAFYRSTLASRRGDIQKADQWLKTAADLGYPKNEIKRSWGILRARVGDFAAIQNQWKELLEHPGADGESIYRGFIVFALATGLLDDAEKVVALWQAYAPQQAEPYRYAGLIYSLKNDWPEAIHAYEQGLSFASNDEDMIAGLAESYMKQLQFEKALLLWQKLHAIAPHSVQAVTSQADCHSKLGESGEGEKVLKKSYSLVEHDPQAMSILGRVYLEQGKVQDSIDAYEKSISLQPEDIAVKRDLLHAYRVAGTGGDLTKIEAQVLEGQIALENMKEISNKLSQQPLNADLRYQLAMLTWKWKSHDEGLRWLRVVLLTDPTHEKARQFLKKHAPEDRGRQKVLDIVPTKSF